jgi:hypothetical protein
MIIYGIDIKLPEPPEHIEDWGESNPKNQYWRRRELPAFFEEVEYDRDGNAILNLQQRTYALEEVRRCKEGFWFYNNGIKTYITGKNYFYLSWWKLENDVYPDYRDTDRRYFLYLNHWEKTSWCLGIVRGKKRREGATSQATSNLVYECIFFKNSFCGLTSKTQIDAKTAFTNMVSFGYRQLPVFLKPKQLNNKDSVTELVFAHKSVTTKGEKGSAIDTDTGHRSKVDFRAPTKNAYDSGRLSRFLGDEMGKWPVETPASEFLAIVSKTMVQGVKRVGFCELPSTVNEMTKGGGGEFKKIWDLADIEKYGGRTPNRITRYFTPAYDGFVGFIDRYGMSVIDEPTEEQAQYLIENYVGSGDLTEEDVRVGAKKYLESRRVGLESVALEEEIRMNPFDEREMFMARNANCHFDAVLLLELYDKAKSFEKQIIEYGNWVWKDGIPFSEAVWERTSPDHARWRRPYNFILPNEKRIERQGNSFLPLTHVQFIAACDPFQNSITEDGTGSKASGGILNRFDEKGQESIFNRMMVCVYHARPKMAELLHMDMALMCFAYGCQILIENKMDGGMRKFFIDNGLENFLIYLPGKENAGVDPNSDNKALMVNLWEAYILTEGKKGKMIYPDVIDEPNGKDGLLKFDVNETEPSDRVMGLGWLLVADHYKRVNFRTKQAYNIRDYFPTRKVV